MPLQNHQCPGCRIHPHVLFRLPFFARSLLRDDHHYYPSSCLFLFFTSGCLYPQTHYSFSILPLFLLCFKWLIPSSLHVRPCTLSIPITLTQTSVRHSFFYFDPVLVLRGCVVRDTGEEVDFLHSIARSDPVPYTRSSSLYKLATTPMLPLSWTCTFLLGLRQFHQLYSKNGRSHGRQDIGDGDGDGDVLSFATTLRSTPELIPCFPLSLFFFFFFNVCTTLVIFKH